MATLTQHGAVRAPVAPHSELDDESSFAFNDFEAELKQLAAANQQLLSEFHTADDPVEQPADALPANDSDELTLLRDENNRLRLRVEELEAIAGGQGEELWQERQREYEMLLEEKSEVIRGLHQKIHEAQESVSLGEDVPAAPAMSSVRVGQAEEILRLKRELEEQRKQLEQDEEDMMAQMRQMEMTMAKERAEMARQRQEVQRLQAEMARETEQANRDPELREKLQGLRREPKQAEEPKKEQKSSGFFRRIFG